MRKAAGSGRTPGKHQSFTGRQAPEAVTRDEAQGPESEIPEIKGLASRSCE